MNSRINFIKGSSLEEKIQNIDILNTHHLMWVYKNIVDIYKINKLDYVLSLLVHANVEDYSFGCIIYDDICLLIFKIYNIKHEDLEIEYLKNIFKIDGNIMIDEAILSFKEDIEKSLFVLCTPIMNCCLKQVVDLFAYVYKINYNFNNINYLLEKYQTRSDVQIELLLLKMKLINFKKLNNDSEMDILINKLTIKSEKEEFTNNKYNIKSEKEEFTNNKYNIKSEKEENINNNYNFKSEKEDNLKDLILEYENTNLNFFIENICLYLEYKTDTDFLHKLVHYSQSGYKHLIIKNISIELYEKIKTSLEMNDELIKKGIYDYKYFMKWSLNCFQNLSILKINDFIEISRLFINYFRKEEDKKDLLNLLKKLINLEINYVSEKVKINILESINDIFNILENINETFYFINEFIIECSKNIIFKSILVRKMEILKYFKVEDKNIIITNLFRDFNLDWRYRKTLIERCVKYSDILGFKNNNWLNHFENDKVYFIREMCKKIKAEKEIIIEKSEETLIEKTEEILIKKSEEIIIEKAQESLIEKAQESLIEKAQEIVINKAQESLDEKAQESLIEKAQESLIEKAQESLIEKAQESLIEKIDEIKLENNLNKTSDLVENTPSETILDRKPLENNELLIISPEIKKDELFDKLKNNVKNRIKSIEEKIVFVSEKKEKK